MKKGESFPFRAYGYGYKGCDEHVCLVLQGNPSITFIACGVEVKAIDGRLLAPRV